MFVCFFSQVSTAGTGGQAEHAGAGAQEIHGAERWVFACTHAAHFLTQVEDSETSSRCVEQLLDVSLF